VQPGTRLGPYEVVARIGAGGMGEVYRARDERIGRDVAIKILPAKFAADPDRLRRFEQEARAAGQLNHPNILTVHDTGTHEGAPYIVTELLEGQSLRERLRSGGLGARKAVEIAVQIAHGLAASHEKGIIHRDLKPANVFITRDGHVKILDFGIAKLAHPDPVPRPITLTPEPSTETGSVLGTVGYMSPEQVRGLPADQRTDIFSFGCVIYEMLSGRSPFRRDTAPETMTAILHDNPPALAGIGREIPQALEGVVNRCLEKRPEDRFSSARDLGFALQAVVESVPREAAPRPEEPHPYPGLAAFAEADAERFFGREEEVSSLWQKTSDRALLALIGPSGVGKTSFLRAGIIPHAPPGWRCLIATPGRAPFSNLARTLAPSLAGDPEAVQRLFDFHQPQTALSLISQWRQRSAHGLVILDQFEELFTLNGEDVRARFAELLGKIAALDGVHVLLSMRDDFLFSCHIHTPLAQVFDGVTPMGPPTGDDLRRAVVEPARRCGYAFEDDALVEGIVQSVEGERGALPLLAFAVARLWEERDKEKKLLTRRTYERLGGVAGALAQHAEATLERIGNEREPIVRELFRNLATSQQTRCAMDAEELLSVFPETQLSDARQVLTRLIGARLLTSFEVEGPDGQSHHRIEIVHESLLQRWPRLLRWQAQDAEGALLRDQLRQAARLWEEKRRPADLLWTETSYQEYEVWRARYPGGLSEVEEMFAKAMVSQATRRRQTRRMVYAAVLGAVILGASGLGVLLRKSVRETHRAEAAAAQREAAQLLALGRLKLPEAPNAALAYAIASLERADNDPARRFAVEALWQGPAALTLSNATARPYTSAWSPDNRWIAIGGETGSELVNGETGERRQLSRSYEAVVGFTPDSHRLWTGDQSVAPRAVQHLWSVPGGEVERTVELAEGTTVLLVADSLLTLASDASAASTERPQVLSRLSLDGATRGVLGQWKTHQLVDWDVDSTGRWIFSNQGGRLVQQRLDALSAPPRVFGTIEGDAKIWVRPWFDRVVTGASTGDVRVWDVASGQLQRALKGSGDARAIGLDPRGRYIAAGPGAALTRRSLFLFDLNAPRIAAPCLLLGSEEWVLIRLWFSPDGRWLAGFFGGSTMLWNLTTPRSIVLGSEKPPWITVAFTRDGHLLSASAQGVLRDWPLAPTAAGGVRTLWSQPNAQIGGFIEIDPRGRFAVVVSAWGPVVVVPLDGSPPSIRELKRPQGVALYAEFASLDPSGRFLAVFVRSPQNPKVNSLRVLDLSKNEERALDTRPKGENRCERGGNAPETYEGYARPLWLPDGRLVTDGSAGLRIWDLATGSSDLVQPCKMWYGWQLASRDSRVIVRLVRTDQEASGSSLSVVDLSTRATHEITTHGTGIGWVALDPSGTTLVTGDRAGVVRVGPISGEEPHLLYGHSGPISSVAISPDGRWIASGSDDGTIRLWPMPDLSKPPLHTLPHDELLAKLKSLNNLRAVRDPASDAGWKIEVGPFPGWVKVPEWQP
jgi:serine/threonine protein kinase/WD40 repeat protein